MAHVNAQAAIARQQVEHTIAKLRRGELITLSDLIQLRQWCEESRGEGWPEGITLDLARQAARHTDGSRVVPA